MNTYLIAYDLAGTKGNPKLFEEIQTYPNWAKPLESVWLIKTTEKVSEVRDKLISHVNADAKILVLDVSKMSWGTYNVSQEVNEWIKNNISE